MKRHFLCLALLILLVLLVFPNQAKASSVMTLPESSHPYESNLDKTWSYTLPGANCLKVAFSTDTIVEAGYDSIEIYSFDGLTESEILNGYYQQVGRYTGRALAGESILVPGDTVQIRLISDGSTEMYGFCVTQISACEMGQCGKYLEWVLDNNVLTISGSGKMSDYSKGESPWWNSRGKITAVNIDDRVQSIGKYAFCGLTALKELTIPSHVNTIWDGAFYGCSALNSISIPDSVAIIGNDAFRECSGLKSIRLPRQGLKKLSDKVEIPGFSFSGYAWGQGGMELPNELWEMMKPGAVIEINYYSNSGDIWIVLPWAKLGWTRICQQTATCNGSVCQITFEQIADVLGSDISTWGEMLQCESSGDWEVYSAYIANKSVGNETAKIGNSAFAGCDNLSDVYYGGTQSDKNEISIGEGNECFTNGKWHYQKQLTWSVEDGVLTISGTSIPDYENYQNSPWYSDRKSITTVILADDVGAIGKNAFWGFSMKNIHFQGHLSGIADSAFYGCSSLTDVYYVGNEEIKFVIQSGNTSLLNALWHYNYLDYSAMEIVELPPSIAIIGDQAFSGTAAEVIIVPFGCAKIADDAFSDCPNLKYIINHSELEILAPDGVVVVND